jgi:D-xylose transport system substrate-binding protein
VWVTAKNMASTVIADKFVDKALLCAGAFAATCSSAGIS